jgi:CHASE2 domain-containing sensor protein
MFRNFSCVALGTLVALAYLAGALDFLERSFQDARFRLTSKAASGDVVVVAIDSDSLAWLEVWPWPRRHYAEVLERLMAAGAQRIALDLDFSSDSDPEDDARLAEVLASAGPNRIALPIFRQLYRGADGASTTVDTAPLSRLQDGATLVHVDFQPDADGAIRSVRSHYERQGRNVPTLALWLDPERPAPERITIDFGIDALSIPQLSFADVLEGTFDPQAVAGKHIIVGATANELRDIASVPRYRLLPGPIIPCSGL